MEIYLADQTAVFLQACLLGAVLALLYDCFRISRIAFRTPAGVLFFEDLLFFIICAVVTFVFMLSTVDGKIRFFILIGELIGGVVYRLTLGYLIMKVSKEIIRGIKCVLRFLFRFFCLPIFRLCYLGVRLLLVPIEILRVLLKKIFQKCRFRLKVGRVLLYNQVINLVEGGRKKKQGKG